MRRREGLDGGSLEGRPAVKFLDADVPLEGVDVIALVIPLTLQPAAVTHSQRRRHLQACDLDGPAHPCGGKAAVSLKRRVRPIQVQVMIMKIKTTFFSN